MTTGERIKEARKKAGMTQAQLSERSGIAAISIHQYEQGNDSRRLSAFCVLLLSSMFQLNNLLTWRPQVNTQKR